MKKLLAIILALTLCVCVLSVAALAAETTTTVHALVPADWSAPNTYGWFTGSEGSVAWPGTPMTHEDGQWYVGTITMGEDNVIINSGSGSPQTVDLPIDAGLEIWVVVGSAGNDGKFSAQVFYEKPEGDVVVDPTPQEPAEPAPFAAPSSLAIVGSAIPGVGEWDPADAAGDMTETSSLVYTKEIDCPAGTSMTFKFAGNDTWDDTCNLGSADVTIGNAAELVNGADAQDMTLSVAEACVLTFTVDLNPLANGTGAATVLVEQSAAEPTEPSEEPTEPSEEPTEPSEEPTEASTEAPTDASEGTGAAESADPTEGTQAPDKSAARTKSILVVVLVVICVILVAVVISIIPSKKVG